MVVYVVSIETEDTDMTNLSQRELDLIIIALHNAALYASGTALTELLALKAKLLKGAK